MAHIPVLCMQVDAEIQLRLHEPRYAEAFFALTERNQAYLREWMPWADGEASLAMTRSFMQQTLQQFARGEGFDTGIWYRGQLAGSIGLPRLAWADGKTEIGYWLDAPLQGRGIVTRACRALTSFAFHEYRLKRVEIHCATGNSRSRAIPARLGFTQDSNIGLGQLLSDRSVDLVIYRMLAAEWNG